MLNIKKSRLYDIAVRCNLSISTVSRALRNEKGIALETKKKVLNCARELGYFQERAPNITLESTSKLIGLLISDVENMYFHSLTRGVEDMIAKNGYSLILCNTDEDPDKEAEYMKILLKKEVDGIILSPAGQRIPWREEFQKMNVPIVIIDRQIEEASELDYVGVNNREASCRGVEYLIGLGHRRIGILIAIGRLKSFQQRLEGYLDALKKNKIPIDEELIIYSPERTIEAAQQAIQNLFLSNIQLPTALFCTNNLMSLGTIIAAKKNNIMIPQQLSILGFDDFDWSEALNPPLTAISQPTYAIGATAAQILLRRIGRGGLMNRQEVIIDVQLTIRESCRRIT